MTLRALEAHSTQSWAWGPKVKWVSSVTPRILRGSVQRSHRVTDSHGGCQRWTVSLWISGSNGQLLAKRNIIVLLSPRPKRCWEQRQAAWSCLRRTSCLNREMGSPTQSGWRVLGRWPIPVGPPPVPGGKASNAADRGTRPSCRGGMPQATSPNFVGVGGHCIISMRMRWETVSNDFEMSTTMAIVLLGAYVGWKK